MRRVSGQVMPARVSVVRDLVVQRKGRHSGIELTATGARFGRSAEVDQPAAGQASSTRTGAAGAGPTTGS